MDKKTLARLRGLGYEFDSAYDDLAELLEKSRADDTENKKKREEAKLKAETENNSKSKENSALTKLEPGKNGRPVQLYFGNEMLPMQLTGGWERGISAFLEGNKRSSEHIRGLHCAVDIACSGTSAKIPIYATHSGTVQIGIDATNAVYIQDGVFRTVYAHMWSKDILVKNKEEIEVGHLIGYMGSAGGRSVHLHYEIQYNISTIAQLADTGEYGVFSSGKIWKSINPFTYEGEPTPDGQPLGRAIPGSLLFHLYTENFVNIQILINYWAEYKGNLSYFSEFLRTIPRCEALLNWLKANGL